MTVQNFYLALGWFIGAISAVVIEIALPCFWNAFPVVTSELFRSAISVIANHRIFVASIATIFISITLISHRQAFSSIVATELPRFTGLIAHLFITVVSAVVLLIANIEYFGA